MHMDLKGMQKKKMGFKRFIKSFRYSVDGLVYAFINEQSLFIHFMITLITVVLGILLKLSQIEWLFVFLMIGLVICAELINTSIEAVVDLASPEIHPLAKIAKDTASAAVFCLTIVAFTGGIMIYIPKLMGIFMRG